MKIFPKYYVRRLYNLSTLDEIISVLLPWSDIVTDPEGPFLRQVAAYLLEPIGKSLAPRFFKTILAREIYRLTGKEDLKQIILLAVVECFRRYDPKKGKTNLVNWLSWMVPYEVSKWVTWKVTHPIGPFDEIIDNPPEVVNFQKIHRDMIAREIKLVGSHKKYYLLKSA